MKIRSSAILFALALLMSLNVSATVITFDDGADAGARDSGTGLDWRRFDGGVNASSTIGLSHNNVTSNFGVGDLFDGWRYATRAEILAFISNVSGVTHVADAYSASYDGVTDAVAAFLGYTHVAGKFEYVYGVTADISPILTYSVALFDGNDRLMAGQDSYRTNVLRPRAVPNARTASWLVRDTTYSGVPEPSILGLMAIGLLGIGGTLRRAFR